ncbi:hypothetical protein BYT27DRAFT_7303850, partial [Phlegmacium glaucopus]
IIEDHDAYKRFGGIAGLRVAQVRIIFELPPQFGYYLHPLAYVEWFTSLGNPDPLTGMHTVTRSTCQSHRNVSIVPVTQIARGCHLIAKSGREISLAWTTDNVLEQQGIYYYVNPYVHVRVTKVRFRTDS